ncbi:MAG: hypothetical protein QNJ38_16765, partial [Prochloraceae cyanobacterium]|nr:hypothetical protein [Prochloraceae cyanobacterium]
MKEKTVVKIIRGASNKIDKFGIVTNINGIGINQGKVEVEIAGMGKSWYNRTHLEIVKFKTKLGDEIEITSVLSAITNIKPGQTGVVVQAPAIKANSIEVGVKLDDGQTIKWLESNLKVVSSEIESSFSLSNDREPLKQIEIFERNGKTFAWVKDLSKHPVNSQIYSDHNIKSLKQEIVKSRWIKTLVVTNTGLIISGNSRFEAATQLGWKILPVEVRYFKNRTEEVKALLLENTYRQKTREELGREAMLWEEIMRVEAIERKRQAAIATNEKLGNTLCLNLSTASENLNKGRATKNAAEKVGLKNSNYEKIKKVINTFDRLASEGRSKAAHSLQDKLNNKSVHAAHKKLKDLERVEKAIPQGSASRCASYQENNQLDRAEDLTLLLDNHTITEATIELESYVRDDRKTEANFQHLDIVRIKSKEHQGEWAILDVYDEDKLSAVVLSVTGEIHVLLVNLEKIELTDEQKQYARQLMPRLQAASYNLQGKGEPYGYQTIQYILKKPIPELSALEEKFLQDMENVGIDAQPEENKEEKDVNQIDSNLALNNFINSLEYTGLD